MHLVDVETGEKTLRAGLPVLRPKGAPLPCHKCPKTEGQPARTRRHAVEFSPRNRRAFWHYQECRAVLQFPDDPIVRRNAALLRQWFDLAERRPLERLAQTLSLVTLAASPGRRGR